MELIYKEENRKIMAIWPDVVRDITETAENLNIPHAAKWLEKVLEYNIQGGKKIHTSTLIYAYKMLIPNGQLTEDNIRLAHILAWCVEIVNSSLFMLTDIVDQTLFRQGKPCWYRYNDIGEAAANDSILLISTIYYIIRKYCGGSEYYVDILEIFHDIILKSSIGSCLELCTTNFGKKPNLDLFTMNRYNSIIENKTSRGTILFPVTVAMQLAGIKDPEMFRQATPVMLEIGCFYQIQDDYAGCYGEPLVNGKDDTDIQEGKCTWFVVKALERATSEQRKILEECYGVSDPEKIKRVKQLFADLNLLEAYLTYKKEAHNLIKMHIQEISCGLLQKLFSDLLEYLYRRVS